MQVETGHDSLEITFIFFCWMVYCFNSNYLAEGSSFQLLKMVMKTTAYSRIRQSELTLLSISSITLNN
jgi:hypothetical protein